MGRLSPPRKTRSGSRPALGSATLSLERGASFASSTRASTSPTLGFDPLACCFPLGAPSFEDRRTPTFDLVTSPFLRRAPSFEVRRALDLELRATRPARLTLDATRELDFAARERVLEDVCAFDLGLRASRLDVVRALELELRTARLEPRAVVLGLLADLALPRTLTFAAVARLTPLARAPLAFCAYAGVVKASATAALNATNMPAEAIRLPMMISRYAIFARLSHPGGGGGPGGPVTTP